MEIYRGPTSVPLVGQDGPSGDLPIGQTDLRPYGRTTESVEDWERRTESAQCVSHTVHGVRVPVPRGTDSRSDRTEGCDLGTPVVGFEAKAETFYPVISLQTSFCYSGRCLVRPVSRAVVCDFFTGGGRAVVLGSRREESHRRGVAPSH